MTMIAIPVSPMNPYEQARERLQYLKTKLDNLIKNLDDLTGKDKVKQIKEIDHIQSQIDNIEAFLFLKIDQRVTDGKSLGVVKDLTLSHGGLPECWVSWYDKVPIPEQPIRLTVEPILEHSMKIGDQIKFKGQSGEISEFLGDGRLKTTEGDVINFNVKSGDLKQGESTMNENQGNSINKDDDAPLVESEVVDEGDVVEIVVKGNPDLRGRGGQWGIISELFEFSVMVKVWDGVIQVRTENLKDLVIPPEQQQGVKSLCDRCHRLIEVADLDQTARGILGLLGRKTWLNEVEAQILGCIEAIYFDGDGDNNP